MLAPSSPFYKSPHLKHLKDDLSELTAIETNEAALVSQGSVDQQEGPRHVLKRRSSWPRARRRSFPRSPMLLSPHLKHLQSPPRADEDKEIVDAVAAKRTKESPPRSPLSRSPVSDGRSRALSEDSDSGEESAATYTVTPPRSLILSPRPPAPPPLPPEFFELLAAESAPDESVAPPRRYHEDRMWRLLRADVIRCQMALPSFELNMLESSAI